jgi:hypothetical protein
MKRWPLLVPLLLWGAVAHAAPAPARDWSTVATRQPDGTFVAGNPKARVRLVEYLSFTCPHCAVMEGAAIPPLTAKYIRTGLVSYEVRHALRDGYDLAAVMLARCNGPRSFFALAPVVYAAQPQWMGKAADYAASAPANLPPDKAIAAAAHGAGLDTLLAAHGLPPARQQACLADAAERTRLGAQADAAWSRPNFPGTPDWLVNGVEQTAIDGWPKLDAALAAALKKR